MTDISPTERQVFPLTAGRNVFLAGMDWKTLPASHKNPRTFARSLGAVRYISCEYLSTEDTDRHIMVAAVSQNTLPKGSRRYFSLAMLILPLLEPGGYAIVELSQANDTELYGFVSAVDGILVSDLVGTREEIREAREIFLTINSAPEHGWTCYEPPSFNGPDGRGPLPLETLTGAGKYPAEARLHPVSRGPQLIPVLLILTLLGTAWYGWQYYERLKAEKAALAEAAQKAAEERITPPWLSMPETGDFIRGCSDVWSRLPGGSLQAHSGRVSFDWEGDALELLSELARLRGQQFSYSGVRLPLPVSLHVRDMTFADALRLTEAQTAWRAVLSQSAGRLHLSYMPTEKK